MGSIITLFSDILSGVPRSRDYNAFSDDLRKFNENLGELEQKIDRYLAGIDFEPPVDEPDYRAWNVKLEQLRRIQKFLDTDQARNATPEFKRNIDRTEKRCNVVVNKMRHVTETPADIASVAPPATSSLRRLVHMHHV